MPVVPTTRFDLILCDIGMPHKDGCDVIRGFRSFDGVTPVIALTAHASASMADRALRAGFTLCLSKPIVPDKLVKQMASILQANVKETVKAT